MEIELLEGTKVAVGDMRKEITERVIAQGVIDKISEQEGVKYAYLNTGYYLVIYTSVKAEKAK